MTESTIPIDGAHKKELTSDAADFYHDYWREPQGVSAESLRRHQEVLQQVFHVMPQALNIAELGVGAEGGVLALLKDCNYVRGFDVSDVAVGMCLKQGVQAELYNGDFQPLPIDDNFFDVTFACEVFEHFANPQHALEEVRRTLKPGGVLALSIPQTLIHHWPRVFYPALIDREPFRDFLMVNKFLVVKEMGIGSNHYRAHTGSSQDVWSWFWVCCNIKSSNSKGLLQNGRYFFEKRDARGIRTHPIEAGDLFRAAWEEDKSNWEAAFSLALALVYKVINGDRKEFLNLVQCMLSQAKNPSLPTQGLAAHYMKMIEAELALFGLSMKRAALST